MLPSNLEFVTSQDLSSIDTYVKRRIKPTYASKYQDFVPLVVQRVDKACQECFISIKKQKLKFLCEESYNLDEEGAYMVGELLNRKYEIGFSLQLVHFSASSSVHAWGPEFLKIQGSGPTQRSAQIRFWWTPQNPYLFEDTKAIKKHYQYDPAGCSKSLLAFAKTATETDVVFVSAHGEKIPAHSLLLKLKCDYFKNMLKGDFKEASSKVIEVPYSAAGVKGLVQFIYEGQTDLPFKDLEGRLELLAMSHEYGISDLFNYSVDLINEFLKKRPHLQAESVEHLIVASELYAVEDFFIPCLIAAERLENLTEETSDQKKVNWDAIPFHLYTKLLKIAMNQHLKKVEQKISLAINQRLSLSDPVKGKEKD
ncbi:BTB/POZ domain-containing protein [Parachlamydia sp. AcF125]|uniref:BTB/POZ domain-containing protein n=1 Tax=Parachlamydia sp. AcF125 TaxID=2795736 RepID=UPI001BC94285|nr:BTB/POZ domain-containing protein [Parachlamydia sp. AcF125]MBS4168483.1 hypothetical protein [Parachlamydia sp. AcF125]